MVVIDRKSDGSLRGVNIIELFPRWEWVTMLSPMPLFFAASGWANTSSTVQSRVRRVRALVGLGLAVLLAWFVASLIELFVTGHTGIIRDGARISTQPLWFLAAWAPFTLFAPVLERAARRPLATLAGLGLFLVSTDALRFGVDAPRWVGFPGFFAAWSVPWILGAWWRARSGAGKFDERRVGIRIVVVSTLCAVVLVRWFGYRPALIDAVPNGRSNTTPPTLYTLVASCVQVGLLMIAAQRLDRVATHSRRLVSRLGELSAGVYAWHLTALSLCGALLAAGLWTPTRLTAAWWWTRPVWFGVVLGVTSLFIAGTRSVSAMFAARSKAPGLFPSSTAIFASATSSAVGGGLIGLYGPRNLAFILVTPILLLVGWATLRE